MTIRKVPSGKEVIQGITRRDGYKKSEKQNIKALEGTHHTLKGPFHIRSFGSTTHTVVESIRRADGGATADEDLQGVGVGVVLRNGDHSTFKRIGTATED